MIENEYTIDELARAADSLVSTVRMYQHRGLLAPPTKRGRVGYYDQDHLERLRTIAQLQDRGYSLASIKELLERLDAGDSLRSALGLGNADSLWSDEPKETMTLVELARRFPNVDLTPAVLERVVAFGLVELHDDSSVVVLSPAVLAVGSELAAMGVPLDEILDEYERLVAQTDAIASRFTELFQRRMWRPFVKRGMPADEIPPLLATLEQLAPLANEVTTIALRRSLQARADTFIQTESRRLRVEIPVPTRSSAGRASGRR